MQMYRESQSWTEDEEKYLYLLRLDGMTFKAIGVVLHRSWMSIRSKYRRTRWDEKTYFGKIDEVRKDIRENDKIEIKEKILDAFETKQYRAELGAELISEAIERAVIALPAVKAPVYKPRKKDQKHESEDVGLILSDFHIGQSFTMEETGGLAAYNFDIFLKRMEVLKKSVVDIVELHSQLYDLPNLHIFCLGDIVAGMNAAGSWSSTYINMDIMSQYAEGARTLSDLIYYLLPLFKTITFYGIYGNHGRSLSKNTRILTPCGYKSYIQIKKGDLVGSVNIRSGRFEWQKVRSKNIYVKKGKMVSVKKDKFSMTVTDDHDILRQSYGTGNFTKVKAKDIKNNQSRHIIPICRPSHNTEHDISDDMLSALGWVMSDGCYPKKGDAVHIYQSKPSIRKKMMQIFERLCDKISVKCRRKNVKEILGVVLVAQQEECMIDLRASDLSRDIRRLLPKRESIPSWMYELSDRQVEVLMDAIVDGDGARRFDRMGKDGYMRRGGIDAIWGKKSFLEALMGLFIAHDISCSLHAHKRKKPKILKSGDQQKSYYLQIKKSKRYHVKGHEFKTTDYNDIAWCVTVDNGIIAALDENGFPYFTGNSAPRGTEKEYANWDILTYNQIQARLAKNDRIIFNVPASWWLKTVIKGHKFLLVHGDDVKGTALPINGLNSFVNKWSSVANFVPNYTIAGHFHTMAELSTARGKLMVNGSFVGPDIFSLKTLHASSPPEQKIFGIHERRGITWRYDIDLREEKLPKG